MTARPLEEDHPTIAEVRRWRAQLLRETGGTLDGLIELLGRTPLSEQPTLSPEARSVALEDLRRRKAG